MPRKNARPAAKKALAKRRARTAAPATRRHQYIPPAPGDLIVSMALMASGLATTSRTVEEPSEC